MNDVQIDIAQEKLSNWLEEQEEMNGNPPKKIKFALGVRDPKINDLIFFVFKFMQTAKGKWLLGIAGGYPDEDSLDCPIVYSIFSEFPEEPEEAANEAIELAAVLLSFKSKNRFKSAFKRNLEYVSNPELDAEKIAGQFVKTQSRYYLTVGTADIPSGRVIVSDPLCYLSGDNIAAPILEKEIPGGSYPVEVSLYRDGQIGASICSARLKIKKTAAVRYELASPTPETECPVCHCFLSEEDEGVVCGFPVEAGLISFIDAEGAEVYRKVDQKWWDEHPDGNRYDDYFAALFAESYEKLPAYQRKGGDFIEWTNPENSERMVMTASGLGDGFYLCFWGYDEDDEICELIVPMVDPDIFEELDDYYVEDEYEDEDDNEYENKDEDEDEDECDDFDVRWERKLK